MIQQIQPDEIYNLGAMSHVHVSFDEPEYVANTDGIGTLRLLEAVRILKLEQKHEYIKLPHLSYMEKFKKSLNPKKHHFIHALHMQWPKCMLIGLQ